MAVVLHLLAVDRSVGMLRCVSSQKLLDSKFPRDPHVGDYMMGSLDGSGAYRPHCIWAVEKPPKGILGRMQVSIIELPFAMYPELGLESGGELLPARLRLH